MQSIKDFITVIRSANPAATLLAALALLGLIIKATILNQIAAPWPSLHDLGIVADSILASIVASYAFYILVVHLKDERDKRTLAQYIDRHTNKLIGHCKSQLSDISKVSGLALDLQNVDLVSVTQAFAKIDPNSKAPLVLGRHLQAANWLQYFNHYRTRSGESFAKLISQIIFLEPEHVRLLANIDDCSFFGTTPLLAEIGVRNKDLTAFDSEFMKYCEACRSLSLYQELRATKDAVQNRRCESR
ncbi:MAG: hypothetical protein ACT6SF_08315 [Hydrogenophaga sp.]|uniref:hypothetical protein n=1 Tax=Hydrogenophaga sp. TaxID=1904254 RepID=UPI0040374F9E